MSYSFIEAKAAFADDQIRELSEDPGGYRFLLLRSLSRAEAMRTLARNCDYNVSGIPARELLQHLYENKSISPEHIKSAIEEIYTAERSDRKRNEANLISELYRIQSFDWGGLHQNSLEKTIVNNYVKKISSYDILCESIDNRLYPSMRSYVLCSWYNHWTSIVIEDVFKDHPSVIPAVGLIEGFIKEKRKNASLKPELTLLKRFARSQNIPFDANMADARLLEDLWGKVSDHPSDDATALIFELKKFRDTLVDECVADSGELIRWLYENQGVRRFDASNRLFLILIKKGDYFNSWKLKRARDLLVSEIHSGLEAFDPEQAQLTEFLWEGSSYQAMSSTIFVVRD